MSTDPTTSLTEIELDALWTVYEGHSLVIERPVGDDLDDYAHAVMSISYDEEDEALAEVAELPLDTVESLIQRGYLERSPDGPVLDASSWFDEELGRQVEAEEYVLSELGQSAIDSTAEPLGTSTTGDDPFGDDELDDLDDLDDDDDLWDDDDDDIADLDDRDDLDELDDLADLDGALPELDLDNDEN